MLTVLKFALTALAFFAMGYLVRGAATEAEIQQPFPDQPLSDGTSSLGCRIITESVVEEDRLVTPPIASSRIQHSSGTIAIKIASDGRTASVLYSNDVAHGNMEPELWSVQTNNKDYVVASSHMLLGEESLIVDVKTGKAALGFAGQGPFGIRSIGCLLQCS